MKQIYNFLIFVGLSYILYLLLYITSSLYAYYENKYFKPNCYFICMLGGITLKALNYLTLGCCFALIVPFVILSIQESITKRVSKLAVQKETTRIINIYSKESISNSSLEDYYDNII